MNVELRDEARDDLVDGAIFMVSNQKVWTNIFFGAYERTSRNSSRLEVSMNNSTVSIVRRPSGFHS